jgi:hypothetical protein
MANFEPVSGRPASLRHIEQAKPLKGRPLFHNDETLLHIPSWDDGLNNTMVFHYDCGLQCPEVRGKNPGCCADLADKVAQA